MAGTQEVYTSKQIHSHAVTLISVDLEDIYLYVFFQYNQLNCKKQKLGILPLRLLDSHPNKAIRATLFPNQQFRHPPARCTPGIMAGKGGIDSLTVRGAG